MKVNLLPEVADVADGLPALEVLPPFIWEAVMPEVVPAATTTQRALPALVNIVSKITLSDVKVSIRNGIEMLLARGITICSLLVTLKSEFPVEIAHLTSYIFRLASPFIICVLLVYLGVLLYYSKYT